MRARQPDGAYDSNDSERELAVTEESISLSQSRPFCLE
jgi:hypothetical protein